MIPGAVLNSDGNGVACLVPMADRCAARATAVREYAESIGVNGQPGCDLLTVARRLAWDAYAAGEYPRPLLSDAVDLVNVYGVMSAVVWHLVAGATILGPGCDCQPPGAHRDALVQLSTIVAGDALRAQAAESESAARETVTGDPWGPGVMA